MIKYSTSKSLGIVCEELTAHIHFHIVSWAVIVFHTYFPDSRKVLNVVCTVIHYQPSLLLLSLCGVQCMKPVIACVHSACVGGGVDMITACDIRLCSQDAWFQVKVGVPPLTQTL